MSFPRYLSYKETAVGWLGAVPEHWAVLPAKRSFFRRKELNRGMKCKNRLALTMGGVVPRDLDDLDGLQASEFETYQVFNKDDLAFKLIDLQNIKTSRVGIVPELGIMSPAYIRLVPQKDRIVSKFAYWYFTDLYNRHVFNELGGGVRQTMAAEELLLLPFPMPEYSEQTAITCFIDSETSKIDKLVAEQRRLIELLTEKRQAVISHAVTKGLNPHAPVKPSGIEWLGDVPKHWMITKLGRFASVTKLTGFEYTNHWAVDPDGDIIALRGYNIKSGKLDLENVDRISSELSSLLSRSKLYAGDIVFPCTGSVGDAAIIPEDDKYHINQNIAKITFDNLVTTEFALCFLFSVFAKQQFDLLNTSGLQPVILIGNIRGLIMVVPPIDEQIKIAKYIHEASEEYDSLIAETKAAIELLQERRTALISAAVTGKIDVRGLAQTGVA